MTGVRRTTVEDRPGVRDLVAEAFGGTDEVELVEWVWSSAARLPALDLVAEDDDGAVVGHVLHSRAWIGECDVAALAPLAVSPATQRRGVGSALVTEALRRADAAGEVLVVLLGHPAYYPRFGFRPARSLGLEPPGPLRDEAAFMACPLPSFVPGRCTGALRWAWGDRW